MYAANVAASRRKLPSFSKSPKVITLSIMIITSHLFKMNEMGAKKKPYRLPVNDKPSNSQYITYADICQITQAHEKPHCRRDCS